MPDPIYCLLGQYKSPAVISKAQKQLEVPEYMYW